MTPALTAVKTFVGAFIIMEKEIPIDMMIGLMLAAGDTLEVEDEGEYTRVKGMFVVKDREL